MYIQWRAKLMKFIENKEAVSPVVGVMLMLVVTLIIAGVVSAFGGGLVSTTTPTPQASISSSLTLDDSLIVTHNGGDSLIGSDIDVKAKIVSGGNKDMIFDVIIANSTLPRTDKAVTAGSLQTGDSFKVTWDDTFPQIPGSMYEIYPSKGDLVTVTILDKNSGKQIASQTVTVN
jgi:FlaG/FlaF family flagellin (archaellin)